MNAMGPMEARVRKLLRDAWGRTPGAPERGASGQPVDVTPEVLAARMPEYQAALHEAGELVGLEIWPELPQPLPLDFVVQQGVWRDHVIRRAREIDADQS